MERYRKNAGSVYSLQYHLVWCPKYRRPVLTGDVAVTLHAILAAKASDLDVTLHAVEVLPDHVHLVVESDPTLAVQFVVNQFKGSSARILRDTFPSLRTRLPNMWSRSYYAGTVGVVSEATIRRYIELQKGR